MAQPGQFSRRKFAGVAAGAAAPLLAAVTADAIQADVIQVDDKQPDEAKPLSPTDRLLELIQQQYPDKRLDAAGLAEIREDLDGWLARSARLSAYPLTNADEPGFVVRAYRKE